MIKMCIVFLVICMFLRVPLFAMDKMPFVWHITKGGKGAEAVITGISDNAFKLMLTKVGDEYHESVTAVKTVNQSMPSQNVLIFSVKSTNDHPVRINPIISYLNNGRTIMKFGPKILVSGSTWKDYSLNLDSSFQLGDALFNIQQLKFAVSIKEYAAGAIVGIEFKNVKLCAPDEAGVSSSNFVICQLPPLPETRTDNKLRIYFHLDNDDLSTVVHNRRIKASYDMNAYDGFRDMLLESAADDVVVTRDLECADIIVYSSCTPDPAVAKRIAAAVYNGVSLYAASEIADPEIAEILPAEILDRKNTEYPERFAVQFADTKHLIARGVELSQGRFGKYRKLTQRNGSKPLVIFEDQSPAVVEGHYGKGVILYSTFTLGSDLIPNTAAKDEFMLRGFEYLSGHKIPIKPYIENYRIVDGWRNGASESNFGRFGIKLGDGLLVEEMNNSLVVNNGSAEYAFSLRSNPKIQLSQWSFRDLASEKEAQSWDWREKWDMIGKVMLSTTCFIPNEWKESKIRFVVENGIDDVAEVFFNDKRIGKVTTEDERYWEKPHNHEIPQDLIKYGDNNEIVVVTENLRGSGGFGSCPEIDLVVDDKPSKATIDRINWLGKGGYITEENGSRFRFDTSLAFPGIRWDIESRSIDLSLHNVAVFAACPTNNGVAIFDLRNRNDLPIDWNAPWLLLFGEEHPLLLVFQHKPASINVLRFGDRPTGLQIHSAGDTVGAIIPIWIYGRAPITHIPSWEKVIPPETMAKINFWYPKSFNYPASCQEYFRIDEINKKVIIKSTFVYVKTQDDWKTPLRPYAPISPLAHMMKGKLVVCDQVDDWDLVTGFGNYAARDDSDTVYWSLPLPSPVLSVLPLVTGFDEIKDRVNNVFSAGNRWSAGGHTTFTDWTPQQPMGKIQTRNLSMHAWIMGLNQALSAQYILSDQNKELLRERILKRYILPIECFQYKVATRWREEPFSRLRYPVYFNSLYKHSTVYEGRPASAYDYGDQNETAMMILSLGQQLADVCGQQDMIVANWNFYRDVARFPLISDDWGYMSCHCRESGSGAMIDMLNCEYALMMKLARLAQIAGDQAMYDQARYRAARRMVPSLARFYMKDYAIANLNDSNRSTLDICLGFKESGAVFRRKSDKYRDVELLDMSQGTENDLLALYRGHALSEIRTYLHHVIMNGNISYGFIGPIADLSDIHDAELLSLLEGIVQNEKLTTQLMNDWPGISIGANVMRALYRLKGKVFIDTATNIEIHHSEYDPSHNTFIADITANENSKLTLSSKLLPVNQEQYKCESGLIPIMELKPGRQMIEIEFH